MRFWTGIHGLAFVAVMLSVTGAVGCSSPGPTLEATAHSDLASAIAESDVRAVQEIIDKGADVNAKDESGMTPLHHAVTADNRKIITLLLDAGADPTLTDAQGQTPKALATQGRHSNAISALR